MTHIDRFDSAEHLKGRKRTYATVKAAVLAAGRFSVFEATASRASADLFNSLERDPDVVCDHTRGYPWIYVTAVAS